MKVIHLTAYGNPAQNLMMVEVSEPNAPSASEALVRMEYAPINYSDLLLANGVYFLNPKLPSVIGGEGAGIVEAIGPGVTSVKVGDRVTIPFGTFSWSEKVLAPARGLFVVPPSVDAKTASMLNINPTTAVLLLDEFVKLKPKDWIVLNAANSHVARCLIAIAKSRDLNVVGIVRRSELIPEIKNLGVDFVGVESPELSKQIQIATGGMPIPRQAMSYSISTLLTRNLHDVFGENDPARRRAAIDEIFTEDCVFYEPRGVYRGRDEIDRVAGAIKATHPDFRYQPIAEPEELGNGGRIQWVSGRPGEAPAYAGTDFIIARDGRIAAVYLFFDKLP
jgi:hypothetical protein